MPQFLDANYWIEEVKFAKQTQIDAAVLSAAPSEAAEARKGFLATGQFLNELSRSAVRRKISGSRSRYARLCCNSSTSRSPLEIGSDAVQFATYRCA
jgi:hypothetical protein